MSEAEKKLSSDADDSLLVTSTSPHIHSGSSVRGIMLDVIISLLPCAAAALVFFGLRSALLIAVCVGAAVATEWLCRLAMKRENTIGDLSAVITGLLLALTLPIGLPLWQAALGSVFAIAVAKQIFGGLGYNPFNPALAGRAFLLISYTAAMTTWNASNWLEEPGNAETTSAAAAAEMSAAASAAVLPEIPVLPKIPELPTGGECGEFGEVAATTTATPLGVVKSSTKFGNAALDKFKYTNETRKKLFFGNINGSIGETSALAILIGFAYLLIRRVITWHATAGYMGAVAVFALCVSASSPRLALPVDFHLLAGGALFGAVFMATDMVTSPVTKWGRLVFGIGCGVLTMIIRVVPGGAYPEGVTFAILIMNALTPLINRATRYRRFGAGKRATA